MTPYLRTLPVTVHPGSGESWHSWVTRLSARIDLGPLETLKAIGYTADFRRATALPGYGITASPATIDRVATITRNQPEHIAAALLDQYDGGPISLTGLDPTIQGNTRKLAMREWVHLGTSAACPACLTDTDQWQLSWRLPWSAICTRHRLLHVSTCPGCGELFNAGRRRDGSLGPYSANTIAAPGTCQNPHRDAAQSPYPRLCAHLHSSIPSTPCEQSDLLAAQHALDGLLQPAHRTSNNEWWNDLRALTAALLAHATTDLYTDILPGLPDTCLQALDAHHEHRDDLVDERRTIAARGGDARTGRRLRVHTATPTDPDIIAPAQTLALAILHTDLHTTPPHMPALDLPPTLDATRDLFNDRGKPLLTQLRSRHASDHLMNLLKIRSGYNALLTHPAITPVEADSPGGLQPRNIPRLIPWEEYEPVADMMRATRTTDDYSRAYLSICLAKLLTGGTWMQAAAAIGADPKKAKGHTNAVTGRLRQSGDLDRVYNHLHDALARWQNDPGRHDTDYRQLAATYGRRHAINRIEFVRITTAAGVTMQATEARRRNYAAWQWHTIALMPLAEWPGWDTCTNPANAKEVYRRWLTDDLPRLHQTRIQVLETLNEEVPPAIHAGPSDRLHPHGYS
mgnify:CR=1 FL=1